MQINRRGLRCIPLEHHSICFDYLFLFKLHLLFAVVVGVLIRLRRSLSSTRNDRIRKVFFSEIPFECSHRVQLLPSKKQKLDRKYGNLASGSYTPTSILPRITTSVVMNSPQLLENLSTMSSLLTFCLTWLGSTNLQRKTCLFRSTFPR